MTIEHGDQGSLRRPGLGPNTLRRLVGGSLGGPDIPNKLEYLAGMGPSLGTLVESLSEQTKEDPSIKS